MTKKTKVHSVWLDPHLDPTGDFLCVELKVNASMHKLLSEFAVKSNQLSLVVGAGEYKRYLIKKVLTHSSSWSKVYEVFFSKDIIDNKKVVLKFNSEYDFKHQFVDKIGYFDGIVNSMERLLKPQKIKIEFKVTEVV